MACCPFFSLTLWMSLALPSAGVQSLPVGNFELQCQSDNDYGWPRFKSREDLEASPWASYFMDVYGEIPSKYPICIHDLWTIDPGAYHKANITGHKVVPTQDVQEGDLFQGTSLGYGIYHETWKPLPDNTWTEIAHVALPTELLSYWVWRTRGSGIWYNVGKTKVFPTPADPSKTHAEAIAWLTSNCSKTPSAGWPQQESDIFGFCAREKGYDSLQFEPMAGEKPLGTFGQPGMTEIVMVNIDGKYNCGVEDASKTPLREGWMAARQCDCENYEYADSCGLMPRAPFPMSVFGSSPPLCKTQEGPPFWNRWKACDPTTCKPTKCGPQKRPVVKVPVHEITHKDTFTV
jgi:hypothetical protein